MSTFWYSQLFECNFNIKFLLYVYLIPLLNYRLRYRYKCSFKYERNGTRQLYELHNVINNVSTLHEWLNLTTPVQEGLGFNIVNGNVSMHFMDVMTIAPCHIFVFCYALWKVCLKVIGFINEYFWSNLKCLAHCPPLCCYLSTYIK